MKSSALVRMGALLIVAIVVMSIATPVSAVVNANTNTDSAVATSSTTATVTCATTPNGDSGTIFVVADKTTPLTTKYDEKTFGPSPTPLTTTHYLTNLTPNTSYYARCRIKVGTESKNSLNTLTFVTSVPGLTVSPSSVTVSEPGTSTNVSIKLAKAPTADVRVLVSSTNTAEGTVSPASLVFTPANWDQLQTATLTAVDDTIVDGAKTYSLIVSVDDSASASEYTSVADVVVSATTNDNDTITTQPVIVTAVGDLCKDPGTSPTAQDIEIARLTCKNTAKQVEAIAPNHHIMLGDIQYDSGTIDDIMSVYDNVWSSSKSMTYPVIGNHEQRDALPYGYCQYFDPTLTSYCEANKDYGYMRDLGNNWVLIVAEGTGTLTTRQKTAYDSMIQTANSQGKNIVVAVHQPRFSSMCFKLGTASRCHGNNASVAYYWTQAYAKGVDLVINGHDHKYERFAPLAAQTDANGNPVADPNPSAGLIEIINGMGANINDPGCQSDDPTDTADQGGRSAASLFCIGDPSGLTQSQLPYLANNVGQHGSNTVTRGGVLKLSLMPTSFSWEFREADNAAATSTVTSGVLVDSGSSNIRALTQY